ncbi:hypothetical protein KIH74_04155 [Kineosporia sp. J2-2]|uniref:DUF5666 domain-containing protein n=1 Tax=Kineosporia corallincola TaxID=2835133 RepID=A0ABS5TD33_9ACTN|nr:hypothetical protein [Kineosporia corallincola]MBT0768101.1 hypothetical protein [Kineosporia corallincola]
MNSISRGWLFIILFAVAAVLILAVRGFGGAGNIQGSIDVGPAGTTNPAEPYAGEAGEPDGVRTGSDDDRDDDGDDPVTLPTTTLPTQVTRQPPDTVYSLGDQLLPLGGGSEDLTSYAGERATGRSVPVQSVDADEGFWIGTAGDRIWVQLVGPPPESPFHVKAGDRVTFTGEVVAHDSGFAGRVGVNRAEGSRSLTSQGAHIDVEKRTLNLAS